METYDETILTSYALGELQETERAAVEQYLLTHPAAAAFVAETREFAGTLKSEYQNRVPAAMDDVTKARVEAAIRSEVLHKSGAGLRWMRAMSLIAAALVLSASIFIISNSIRHESTAKLVSSTDLPHRIAKPETAFGEIQSVPSGYISGSPQKQENSGIVDNFQTVAIDPNTTNFANNLDLLAGKIQTQDTFTTISGQKVPLTNLNTIKQNPNPPEPAPAPFTVQFTDGRAAIHPKAGDVITYNGNSTATGVFDSMGVGGGAERGRKQNKVFFGRTDGKETKLPTNAGNTPSTEAFFAYADHDELDSLPAGIVTKNERYESIVENPFRQIAADPLSTFSIDVDTAAYANVRRFLTQNTMPPKDAVRIEELINYFTYSDPGPRDGRPFNVRLEVASCPWNANNRIVRVGVKGKEILKNERAATNLVFLVDVSGSMADENKLALAKEGLQLLIQQLSENDRVAIVTYAGQSGVALPSTNGANKTTIANAVNQLQSGGSTNGASGIQLAYDMAVSNFIKNGVNRVILMTDGDFNVGITDQSQLQTLITQRAKSGVFLSVLGYGMGNLKDATMEMLADKGNGNYAYIDNLRESRKVLVDEMNATLVTIAKDVKIQVEFNPATVGAARLIGYENRVLQHQDFNDDKKDAGEIGAGHTVTALYEIMPAGVTNPAVPNINPLKYQTVKTTTVKSNEGPAQTLTMTDSKELLTVSIRYKEPDGEKSQLLEFPLTDSGKTYSQSSEDLKFAAAVASFGMLLRDSQYKGSANWNTVLELAEEALGADPHGYRREFIELARKARSLAMPGAIHTIKESR
ncbi:MAG: von Willebrand factor type A domain-containing protein [Planctomycetota bacterium]